MDSKNIHIGCTAMMRRVVWEKMAPKSEWFYVGQGSEFKRADVQQRVDRYFDDPHVFFVTDRHTSREIPRSSASQEVEEILAVEAVTLCSRDFERFMFFDPIGVARQGKRR